MRRSPTFERNKLLGIDVTPLTAAEVCKSILHRRGNDALLILNHNLHSVYLYHRNVEFRDLYAKSDLVLVDGWPVLKTLRWSAPTNRRIGSTDWLQTLLFDLPQSRQIRIFVLGATGAVNSTAVERISRSATVSAVAGRDGYFSQDETQSVVSEIVQFAPDLVLVGMGMPRQESFVSELHGRVDAAIATVGGAIDYISGESRLSPRVLGRIGLEWLWRLMHDPRRLAIRYLVEPFFLGVVLIKLHSGEVIRRRVSWR